MNKKYDIRASKYTKVDMEERIDKRGRPYVFIQNNNHGEPGQAWRSVTALPNPNVGMTFFIWYRKYTVDDDGVSFRSWCKRMTIKGAAREDMGGRPRGFSPRLAEDLMNLVRDLFPEVWKEVTIPGNKWIEDYMSQFDEDGNRIGTWDPDNEPF